MPFKRTCNDVDPSATDYTKKTGVFNACSTLVSPAQPTYYQSYWFMYFLHGSNGHDYFAVGHVVAHTHTSPPKPVFRVCLLDINDGYWFGETFPVLDSTFALDGIHCQSDKFQLCSTRQGDHASPILCKSSVEGAEFELVATPRGPTLYAGGQGTFFWGTDWTYQMSFPEMWVTGTLRYKGEVVEVVPDKSMAWLDRQYGVGVGKAGWDLYMLLLENGVKLSIWRSEACGGAGGSKQYVATVVYPDSHHEIYPLDDHVELSRPYVSQETGYLYHAHQVLTISALDARIELEQPWPVGEMAIKGRPDPVTTLFEGYVNVKARIRGEDIKGWGVAERRVSEI